MDTLLQDIRYAIRGLNRSRGFAATALLTLAIGIGANASVFSFVNALLLRPAPVVADPASLVSVFTSDFSSGPYGSSSYPDFASVRAESAAFSGLAAFQESAAVLREAETTERVRAMSVSGEFFDVLGLRPSLGRLLITSDAVASAPRVAVLGHDLWRRTFGSDRSVIGNAVFIDGHAYTVVGVAPAKFDGLNLGGTFEVWTPLIGRIGAPADRGSRNLSMIGRLSAGVTMATAQAQLDTIAANLAREYPTTNMGTLQQPRQPRPMVIVKHSRMHPSFRGTVAMLGAVLMAAVGVVLLVTCANVAGLLLSRTAARTREITIRLALGASRARVLRALVTESLLLGLAGGALGILFALWTADVLPSFFPAEQARLLDAGVDAGVLMFTAVISMAAGALFGFAPALQAVRPGAQDALRSDGGRTSDTKTGFVRAGLVLSQVALTFVLLVASGLLVRSLTNALQADFGFATRDAVVANIELPATELTTEQGALYFQEVLERVRALPGIEAATLVRTLPLAGGSRRGFTMEGYQRRPGEDTELNFNLVEPQYFNTMRIELVEGRTFDARDSQRSERVAMVNDVLAQRYFGGRAVGRRLQDSRGTITQIVGVVGSGKYRAIQEPPLPVVFYPLWQSYSPRVSLIARTAGEPNARAEQIRREVQAIHRSAALFRVMTLADHLAEALAAERLTTALVAASGSMALVLAIVGVYGVIAYGVVRRRKEIGVRIALGARPVDVVRLVVSEGFRVTLIGIIGGVAAALGTTQLLASILYGVSPRDATSFVGAAVLLTTIAIVAAWAPAHRAVRLDPVTVLRQD